VCVLVVGKIEMMMNISIEDDEMTVKRYKFKKYSWRDNMIA